MIRLEGKGTMKGPVQAMLGQSATLLVTALLAFGCTNSSAKPKTSADVVPRELGLSIGARSNGSVAQFFVAPMDKHGMVSIGATDKLFIAEAGGREKQFGIDSGRQWVVQVATKAETFQLILLHDSKRFVNTVQLPMSFSLRAHFEVNGTEEGIRVEWTSSAVPAEMQLLAEAGLKRYEMKSAETGTEPEGLARFPARLLERPVNVYALSGGSNDFIVTATRSGGGITLDSALATYPSAGRLEQIRTVIVMPPMAPLPSRPAIAVEPAP